MVPVVVTDDEQELLKIKGIGVKTIEKLRTGGYSSLPLLAGADPAEVVEKAGLGAHLAATLVDRAKKYQAGERDGIVRVDEDQD